MDWSNKTRNEVNDGLTPVTSLGEWVRSAGDSMPRFVMVSVHSGVAWPTNEISVRFAGQDIRLIPPGRNVPPINRSTFPLAVIDRPSDLSEEDAVRIIRRFLNALAWREQTYIREMDVSSGGAALRLSTHIPDNTTSQFFNSDDLADPPSPAARMALAFYREGLAIKQISIGYSFLSFFKVLNVRFSGGPEQKRWINANVDSLSENRAVARVVEIREAGSDVGDYLYHSGRCAVAHAFDIPLVDPDNIEDQQRLSRDMPLIRGLAALLIQRELGVAGPKRPI